MGRRWQKGASDQRAGGAKAGSGPDGGPSSAVPAPACVGEWLVTNRSPARKPSHLLLIEEPVDEGCQVPGRGLQRCELEGETDLRV